MPHARRPPLRRLTHRRTRRHEREPQAGGNAFFAPSGNARDDDAPFSPFDDDAPLSNESFADDASSGDDNNAFFGALRESTNHTTNAMKKRGMRSGTRS